MSRGPALFSQVLKERDVMHEKYKKILKARYVQNKDLVFCYTLSADDLRKYDVYYIDSITKEVRHRTIKNSSKVPDQETIAVIVSINAAVEPPTAKTLANWFIKHQTRIEPGELEDEASMGDRDITVSPTTPSSKDSHSSNAFASRR